MSLVSTFVDAFKKAAGKQPKKPDIDMKTYGPLGSTTQTGGGAFTPLRPAPESETERGIDRGDVSVGSSDPEEGGEVERGIDRGDVSVGSSDPEEGGEVERPPEPGRI